MLFNAGVSELWRRTTIYAVRALGTLLELSSRQASRQLRLSYVKVVEFQKRGSVHLHALVRADRREDEHSSGSTRRHRSGPPGHGPADGGPQGQCSGARNHHGARHVWGTQIDTVVMAEAEDGRARAAADPAKYATKGTDEFGLLDHRLPSGICRDSRLPEPPCKSRIDGLVARESNDQTEEPVTEEIVTTSEWTFEGSGYVTAGDACLARSVEEQPRAVACSNVKVKLARTTGAACIMTAPDRLSRPT